MDKTEKTEDSYASTRMNFPDDESKLRWLPMLLDAYAIIDKGIALAIRNEEHRLNKKLACRRGCYNCCSTHSDIPVYPLELVGIYWFCIEKIIQPVRNVIIGHLSGFEKSMPCPFLVNSSCSIHMLRPVSCRQFNVFGKTCEEGEDPYYTRREDVLTPLEEYTKQAFSVMLPFYGITGETDKIYAIENSLIHAHVRILQALDWKELAKRMEEFDSKKASF